MLKRHLITVTDTVICKKSNRSHTELRYFLSFRFKRVQTTHDITTTFATLEEAKDMIEKLPSSSSNRDYTTTYVYGLDTVDYTHANKSGYSDVEPYEIVRVVSPKTIELRYMDAELDKDWKPEIIVGGFSGHCTNQRSQKYSYKSNPDHGVMRARLRKDGYFHSAYGRHHLNTEPYKFYDYNF